MAQLLISTPERQAQRFLTLQLVFEGYSVAEAEDLEQTLEMLKTTPAPFDLLLLDVCHLVWYGPVVLQAIQHAAVEGPSGSIPAIRIFSPRSTQEHWLELLPDNSQALELYPPERLLQEIAHALSRGPEPGVAGAGERPPSSNQRTAMSAQHVAVATAERN